MSLWDTARDGLDGALPQCDDAEEDHGAGPPDDPEEASPGTSPGDDAPPES